MADLFDVAGVSEHGQDCLDEHPLVPNAPLADLEVFRIALLACRFDMEAAITENEHLAVVLLDQWVEGGIVNIGRVHGPVYHAPQVVENKAQIGPAVPGKYAWENLSEKGK